MPPKVSSDPCISYGRGGAGNMRRRSSILDAWSKIATQTAEDKLESCSSSDGASLSSKSGPRSPSVSHSGRRASSMWSLSTTGTSEHRSLWKRVFKRRENVEVEKRIERPVQERPISIREE